MFSVFFSQHVTREPMSCNVEQRLVVRDNQVVVVANDISATSKRIFLSKKQGFRFTQRNSVSWHIYVCSSGIHVHTLASQNHFSGANVCEVILFSLVCVCVCGNFDFSLHTKTRALISVTAALPCSGVDGVPPMMTTTTPATTRPRWFRKVTLSAARHRIFYCCLAVESWEAILGIDDRHTRGDCCSPVAALSVKPVVSQSLHQLYKHAGTRRPSETWMQQTVLCVRVQDVNILSQFSEPSFVEKRLEPTWLRQAVSEDEWRRETVLLLF